MLFNSVQFVLFFPICCIVYFVIPQRAKNLFLLLASYYFYSCWNPKYVFLLLASTLITYVSGILISGTTSVAKRKAVVALSFLGSLSILFFFKYVNFFVSNIERILSYLHIGQMPGHEFDIVLPVGISFYTFQALSYTMDVYRGDVKAEKNFIRYALFVSFFPQLVAGPIERSKNLISQIYEEHPFDFDRLRAGLLRMLWGFFLKLVISETAAIFVTEIYDNYTEYSGSMIALATILFAIQIYGDFGGYSNIAIGAAQIMGFRLMENFHNPYFAESVSDFWRRWHISLSTWFRDYLYIPMGGNRKGRIRKYINVMTVFLASGLWHGASWGYVIWGGLNGVYQVIGDILYPIKKRLYRDRISARLWRTLITFILIDVSWIFFRAGSVSQALQLIKSIIFNPCFSNLLDGTIYIEGLSKTHWFVYLLSLILLFFVDLTKEKGINIIGLIFEQSVVFRFAIYWILLFCVLVIGIYGPGYDASQFIYFQF